MALENDKQFQMRVSPDFLDRIDGWRREQADLPGRSEAIRRLVDIALDEGRNSKKGSTGTGASREPAGPATEVVKFMDAAIEEHRSSKKRDR